MRCKYNELLYWSIERVNQVGEYSVPFLRYPLQELTEDKAFVELVPVQKISQYKVPSLANIGWWYQGSIEKYMGANVEVYLALIRFLQK